MNNFTDVGVVVDVMGLSILQVEHSTSSDSKVSNLSRLAIWEGPKISRRVATVTLKICVKECQAPQQDHRR